MHLKRFEEVLFLILKTKIIVFSVCGKAKVHVYVMKYALMMMRANLSAKVFLEAAVATVQKQRD